MNKHPEELSKLKDDWLADPCWDLEDTEGFEEYRDELLIFRLRSELEHANQKLAEHERFRTTLRSFLGMDGEEDDTL